MRTDLAVVQPPSPPYPWTKANVVAADPNFSTPIVRLTDENTHNGQIIQTADNGFANLWNKDSSMIAVETQGGMFLLFNFDGETLQGAQSKYNYRKMKLCFSRTHRAQLFTLQGTKIIRLNFHKVPLVGWEFTTQTEICDFAEILPVDFVVAWTSGLTVSDDDHSFTVGFSTGIQDTGIFVANYTSGNGYRLLDTSTGKVTGEWGTVGMIMDWPPAKIHEVNQAPNPRWAIIATVADEKGSDPGPWIWDIPTLDLVKTDTTGHSAIGFNYYLANGAGGGQWTEIPYINPASQMRIVPKANLPPNFQEDQHASWNNNKGDDAEVFWVTGGGPLRGQQLPYPAAWYNELLGYDPEKGVVYRACQTLASMKSPNFACQNAIAVVSQDGRFVAFTSDLMGTIKGDVFVAQVG